MATFSIEIDDADVDRVTAALCAAGGYRDVSTDNAIAATKAWITTTVANVEQAQAEEQALQAVKPPTPVTFQ